MMKSAGPPASARLLIWAALAASCAWAQVITSVQNPASNILAAMGNYGIAQGSIFVVYGSAMGPATISTAPGYPLQTSLSGTSVSVTSGGKAYSGFMVYAMSTQVAAVMPSNVPVGKATVQVSYNGTASPAFATTILSSGFGISTLNQTGAGRAVVTHPTAAAPFYALVSGADSAKPGVTYTLWGTGLGAANSDSSPATNGDLGTAVRLFVGGVSATVTYRGRSAQPGLDQINFVVPPGVSGCNVSLTVQIGLIVSNTPSMPVAPGGGTCSDPAIPSSAGAAIQAAVQKGGASVAQIAVISQFSAQPPLPLPFTEASASFAQYTPSEYGLWSSAPSAGSCLVVQSAGFPSTPPLTTVATVGAGLNAGPGLTVTPPSGASFPLTPAQGTGSYDYNIRSTVVCETNCSLQPGSGEVSGIGGVNVGPFSFAVTVPSPPTWTNEASLVGIDMFAGVTVTWSGGDPNGLTMVAGSSSAFKSAGISFICAAPTSAGQFTVPAYILLAIPPGSVGTLAVGSVAPAVPFTALGLDAGYATVIIYNEEAVDYI